VKAFAGGNTFPFIGKEFLKRELYVGQGFRKSAYKSGMVNAIFDWLKKEEGRITGFCLTENRQRVKILTLERPKFDLSDSNDERRCTE
jgi:hypothetical protein